MELKDDILYLDKEWDSHIWFVINGHALPYQFDNDDDIINLKDLLEGFIREGFENFQVYESISNIGAIGLMATIKGGEIVHIYND